jgi:Cu2+-exporting ATPase
MGVQAHIDGQTFYVGNKKLLSSKNITIDKMLLTKAENWQQNAQTVFFFADDKNALAAVAVADEIKPSSIEAVQHLHSLGIEVYMLTGDNVNTAKAVAAQVGIDSYKAEVMPQDKYDFVKQLQQNGKIVAMVAMV